MIVSEEPPAGSTRKPEEIYGIIERFSQVPPSQRPLQDHYHVYFFRRAHTASGALCTAQAQHSKGPLAREVRGARGATGMCPGIAHSLLAVIMRNVQSAGPHWAGEECTTLLGRRHLELTGEDHNMRGSFHSIHLHSA